MSYDILNPLGPSIRPKITKTYEWDLRGIKVTVRCDEGGEFLSATISGDRGDIEINSILEARRFGAAIDKILRPQDAAP